jgi:NADPH:quinone reductase-like Zn-dependent oxidoreductase
MLFRIFELGEAAAAHALMESSQHIGKIVLAVTQEATARPCP